MSAERVALLFPGQGAQYPAMFEDIAAWPNAEAILARAESVIGPNMRERVKTPAYLATTAGAQIATLVASIAAAAALAEAGVRPDFVAGQSVGVYAAAVVAGSLQLESALVLVTERATRMMQAFPKGYGLAAIVGLSERRVQTLLVEDDDASLAIANYNAPAQFVIAGRRDALERTTARAMHSGAARATHLDVAVPSHSAMLDPVARALQPSIEAATIESPHLTMIGASTARALVSAADLRAEFERELRVPQRWHDATQALRERGATLFVQCGPGDALADLAAAAFPDARAVAVSKAGPPGVASLLRAV